METRHFEDNENGQFWQGRYRADRLLDEAAVLACAAYVDLNPSRAAMVETLEQSDFTSVQRRIQSLTQQLAGEPEGLSQILAENAFEPDQLDIHGVPGSPASAVPVSEIMDSGGANPRGGQNGDTHSPGEPQKECCPRVVL